MSGSVNKVILVGNLGADPEVRTLQNGGKVANLRIATSEKWREKQYKSRERSRLNARESFDYAIKNEAAKAPTPMPLLTINDEAHHNGYDYR